MRTGTEPQKADLLFNITPGADLVTQAVIAFDGHHDVAWPYQDLNGALALAYTTYRDDPSTGIPQIYPVASNGGDVGFIVRPRADNLTDAELEEAFWAMLQAGGHADDQGDRYVFTEATPFHCPGGWYDLPVAIVAYPRPYGPELPAALVNIAIRKILGQTAYPIDFIQPYVYPASKDANSPVGGLWIAERIDDLADNTGLDDAAMRDIARLNTTREARNHPVFAPQPFRL